MIYKMVVAGCEPLRRRSYVMLVKCGKLSLDGLKISSYAHFDSLCFPCAISSGDRVSSLRLASHLKKLRPEFLPPLCEGRALMNGKTTRPVLLSIVVTAFALTGCEGGGGVCPWQRPSCCDNNLFGCGPFDLPQGCSCGDYLSRSFQGIPLSAKASSSRRSLASVEGT